MFNPRRDENRDTSRRDRRSSEPATTTGPDSLSLENQAATIKMVVKAAVEGAIEAAIETASRQAIDRIRYDATPPASAVYDGPARPRAVPERPHDGALPAARRSQQVADAPTPSADGPAYPPSLPPAVPADTHLPQVPEFDVPGIDLPDLHMPELDLGDLGELGDLGDLEDLGGLDLPDLDPADSAPLSWGHDRAVRTDGAEGARPAPGRHAAAPLQGPPTYWWPGMDDEDGPQDRAPGAAYDALRDDARGALVPGVRRGPGTPTR